jgi:hypothetical protein
LAKPTSAAGGATGAARRRRRGGGLTEKEGSALRTGFSAHDRLGGHDLAQTRTQPFVDNPLLQLLIFLSQMLRLLAYIHRGGVLERRLVLYCQFLAVVELHPLGSSAIKKGIPLQRH